MMKQFFSFFLAIVLSALIVPAEFAQSSAEISFTSANAMPGDEVVVTVSVSNCAAAKSVYIVPQYDDEILEIVSGTWLLSGILADDYSNVYGDAAIAFSENTDINTNIFAFVFKVKESVQSSQKTSVSCEIVIKTMEGKEEIPVAVTVNPGSITVKEADDTVLIGDTNADGKINTRDARAILRYVAGQIDENQINLDAADYNGDGRVNTRDARAILRYIAGLT